MLIASAAATYVTLEERRSETDRQVIRIATKESDKQYPICT